MSYHLVEHVLDELVLPPPEKAVLVAMAEVCHDDLAPFFISQRQLAYRTGYGDRAVRAAIEGLAQRGLVAVVTPGSSVTHEAATYRIDFRAFESWGPAFSWDLSRAEIRAAQATAGRAVDRWHRGTPSGRTRRSLRSDAPQPPDSDAGGSGRTRRPSHASPVLTHAHPSIAPAQGSGATYPSDEAPILQSIDEEEGLDERRGRLIDTLRAQEREDQTAAQRAVAG
jgi:hypothetical protein